MGSRAALERAEGYQEEAFSVGFTLPTRNLNLEPDRVGKHEDISKIFSELHSREEERSLPFSDRERGMLRSLLEFPPEEHLRTQVWAGANSLLRLP